MKFINYSSIQKIIAYCLVFSLLFPLLASALAVPAYASDGLLANNGFLDLIKGLLSLFLFTSFFEDDDTPDSSYQPATKEEPPSEEETESSGEDGDNTSYQRLQITEEKRKLLAKAVYSEARGEPFEGQVAVAAVIINRVLDSHFPNGIREVIFQKTDGSYAFSAVLDGQIHLSPNQTAYEAVDYALNGWDPSQEALYYYNPITATASWIFENTEPIKEIGNHVFAKLKR